jgi:hypothetical protein
MAGTNQTGIAGKIAAISLTLRNAHEIKSVVGTKSRSLSGAEGSGSSASPKDLESRAISSGAKVF